MVGLVLVSHSRALARATQELVRSMTGPALPLAIAAGAGEDHRELGTDAVEISEAILAVKGPEGVLVLMDMGSAILSAETALDLLDESQRAGILFCAAPLVEGAVAAGVTANLGANLQAVHDEAIAALRQKQVALNASPVAASSSAERPAPGIGKPAGADLPAKQVRLTIRNLHGLHARPAAQLIGATRPFHSEITVRNLANGRGPVSVKSLSSLMSLEILQDQPVEVTARGDDASTALEKIREFVESGLGELLPSADRKAPEKAASAIAAPPEDRRAVPVSGGVVIGPATFFKDAEFEIPSGRVDDVPREVERLQQAIGRAEKTLEARRLRMAASAGAANAEIYGAQILALQDPELTQAAFRLIEAEGKNAALAWHEAVRQMAQRYTALRDPYLRERAADIEDIGRQVLEFLGLKKSEPRVPENPSILIADDLTPNRVSALPREKILGVVLLDGGPTAHSSILLRALGIPAVVQARALLAGLDPDHAGQLAFDGSTGELWVDPSTGLLEKLRQTQRDETGQQAAEQTEASQPGATLDGHRVEFLANLGHVAEAEAAGSSEVEGVGLLRTEFLFLERSQPPTEEEQVGALRAIASAMKGRPVVVRTLDAGGDKGLPYLQSPPENNPFLGVRALRLCFAQPKMFTMQLRAILRAGSGHRFRIMFPMVADVADLRRARGMLESAHAALERERLPHLWPIEAGIMIEIPSAALQAEALAEHADFFSIGTNDLTQYTLAADRGNPALGAYQDAVHPAVLRLIDLVVRGAGTRQRPVAVCGEAASDPLAALLFVGLGVQELSMAAGQVPRGKATLRKWKLPDLQVLAREALGCHSAAEVRKLPWRR